MARTKYVGPLILDTDVYARLEREARAAERDALQHARWLVRQGLQETPARTVPGSSASDPDQADQTAEPAARGAA